ncbi:MAG TPA: hypothetical protein VH877_04755 [Polyangia bacterium]|jgi:hypothetical protein|nr:hypothetical protein [Polyangia bacterium]
MSNHPIQMNWVNNTSYSMNFQVPRDPEDGTKPYAQPTTMQPVGQPGNTSQVSAEKRNALSRGPEGWYDWKVNGEFSGKTAFLNVSYDHPADQSQTWVRVECTEGTGFLVSSPESPTPERVKRFVDSTLQHGDASIRITITRS